MAASSKTTQYANKYGVKIFKGYSAYFIERISSFWNCTKSNSIDSWSWNTGKLQS